MSTIRRAAFALLVAGLLTGAGPLRPGVAAAPTPQTGRAVPRAAVPAYLVVDLQTGRPLATRREDVLRTPVAPGSIAKIATLLAALEAGVVKADTTLTCRRRIDLDGETITCSHPVLGRPLTLAEALAHSCNYAFATIAGRLRREDLDRALVITGLPPSDPSVPVPIAALGLRGIRATPEQLLSGFARFVTAPPAAPGSPKPSEEIRRIVLDGLRGAAEYGTANVIGQHGVRALAKTGTAPMPGGRYMGLIVAVAPADRPTVGVVAVAPGAAGMDAAGVAADRFQEALARPATVKAEPVREVQLRIGRVKASGRYEVETVGLEEYVARVVAREAGRDDGLEARKALAITARSYALANRQRHRDDGFDLCDLTHCQALGRATAASRQATEATRGQVLRQGTAVASVYYTASCGGQTERPSQVWKQAPDPPYLVSHSEVECRAATRWSSEIPEAGLVRALRAAGMKGEEIRNLWVRSRTNTGRAARIAAAGFDPQEIDGESFRLAVGRTLGWQLIKSSDFNVTRTAAGYRFDGHGFGHGVGLCVMGAARLARGGAGAEAILATYFPGTTVGGVATPEPRVEVTVPSGAERDRDVAADLVRQALRDFALRLSVPTPGVVSLVFHPTVEAYLRATGQPWWTAAASQGTRVDLLPPSVLRQRGIFERTLRHEIAHVLVADRLRDRPLWVKEATAMYISNEMRLSKEGAVDQAGASSRRQSCPTDDEMRGIASAEAMRDAYARAAACYVEQLAAGKKWDEIR
jgi:stage II sporulation protein D